MHWGDKCCFCFNLELGCTLLGITGFISSLAIAITAGVFISLDRNHALVVGLSHSEHIREAILISALVVALLCILPNLLLVIGVLKSRSGLLLVYFAFGIFFEIFVMISALQFLLQNQWITALIISIFTLIYIRLLMMVYTVYENMQKHNLNSFTTFTSQLTLITDSTTHMVSQGTVNVDT